MAGDQSDKKIGPATWIPLGSALLVAFTIWKGWDWLDNRLDEADTRALLQAAEVQRQFQDLKHHLERVEQRVSDQLTYDRFVAWRDLLEVMNAGKIEVPPVKQD